MDGREKDWITFCHYHTACCSLAARVLHLAGRSKASLCYWVPARGCLIVSNWFQAGISSVKQC